MLGNPEIEAEGPYAVVLAPTRELAQQVGVPCAHRCIADCLQPGGWCWLAVHDRAISTALLDPHFSRIAFLSRSPQIEEETRNLAHYTEFRVVSVVGGQSIEDQGFALR